MLAAAGVVVVAVAAGIFFGRQPAPSQAPEAAKIMAAQQDMKFGILIPRYMPRGFEREAVDLKIDPDGSNGKPVAELTYHNPRKGAVISFRQWVPGDLQGDVPNGSRPIETRWGTGWLLTQPAPAGSIRVDIGQLRVAINSSNLEIVGLEEMLQMADTLDLVSDEQSYTFTMEPVTIKGAAAPPFEVPLNINGVQELNLTNTPGGFQPICFLVKKDIPVKINFRALGDNACGSTVSISGEGGISRSLTVSAEKPLQSVEFIPGTSGDFPFNCAHNTYHGLMMVRD